MVLETGCLRGYSTAMTGPPQARPPLGAACALTLLIVVAPGVAGAPAYAENPVTQPRLAASPAPEGAGAGEPSALPKPTPAKPPRAFLIYLIDGGDPIIVKRYVEENDQVRFEKYGGWVGIPRYEVLRIVPDEPDVTANLPPSPVPVPDTGGPPQTVAGADALYVTMQGGASVKATAVTPEGDRVRVTVPDGSFTLPRADVVGVVRVPSGLGTPEAWLSLVATEGVADRADNGVRPAEPMPLPQATSQPRVPSASSDRPHLLRLANGQLLRVDGFWIEDGEIRFQRFGGLVGVALSEVLRLIPEEITPVRGRTPVRFAQQLGPDLLEVRVQSAAQRVRLIGVEPVPGTRTSENPWERLERGLVLYLEFDRQRYDTGGDWLAYVFLPNGRMLNAELIRLGLARPRPDERNLRYLDLFHEIAVAKPAASH